MARGKAVLLGLGAAVLGLGVAIGAIAWGRVQPYGAVGSAYLAKQYCSCVFVAGRGEGACHADFKPDIDSFKVSVDRSGWPERGRVRTSLLVFHGEATYARGFGCTVAR